MVCLSLICYFSCFLPSFRLATSVLHVHMNHTHCTMSLFLPCKNQTGNKARGMSYTESLGTVDSSMYVVHTRCNSMTFSKGNMLCWAECSIHCIPTIAPHNNIAGISNNGPSFLAPVWRWLLAIPFTSPASRVWPTGPWVWICWSQWLRQWPTSTLLLLW